METGWGAGRGDWRPAARESLCWPLPCQTALRYICSQKINSALPQPGSSRRTRETQRRVGGHPQAPGSWAGRAAGSLPNSPNSLRLVSPRSDLGGPGQRCWLRLPGRWCPLVVRPDQAGRGGGGGAGRGGGVTNRSPEGGVVPGFPDGFLKKAPDSTLQPLLPYLGSLGLPLLLSKVSLEAEATSTPDSPEQEGDLHQGTSPAGNLWAPESPFHSRAKE